MLRPKCQQLTKNCLTIGVFNIANFEPLFAWITNKIYLLYFEPQVGILRDKFVNNIGNYLQNIASNVEKQKNGKPQIPTNISQLASFLSNRTRYIGL